MGASSRWLDGYLPFKSIMGPLLFTQHHLLAEVSWWAVIWKQPEAEGVKQRMFEKRVPGSSCSSTSPHGRVGATTAPSGGSTSKVCLLLFL